MPTYDYECNKCGYKFDLFQSITSKPSATCPKCKSKAQRLISGGGGIIFKGSGFYVTDYKRKDERRKSEHKEEQKTGTADSEKSETSKSEKTGSSTAGSTKDGEPDASDRGKTK